MQNKAFCTGYFAVLAREILQVCGILADLFYEAIYAYPR